jgi:hypothetical protein
VFHLKTQEHCESATGLTRGVAYKGESEALNHKTKNQNPGPEGAALPRMMQPFQGCMIARFGSLSRALRSTFVIEPLRGSFLPHRIIYNNRILKNNI